MMRESEERQEAFTEKHKVIIVDDDDFERLVSAIRKEGGRELCSEELGRLVDEDRDTGD